MEVSSPRQRLLDAVNAYVVEHGIGDLSLRELAAALGTSHRMLIYHFGSKAGLIVALVQSVEDSQRAFLAELANDARLSPADRLRAWWRRLADPSLWPNERLFFEIYAQALQGRPGTAGLLDNIVDAWVDRVIELDMLEHYDIEAARSEARLGVAVIRGLLLDLLATGDRPAVDAALECYIAMQRL